MNDIKRNIITIFNNNVKNIDINLERYNRNHCGKEGHWLERRMGITPNSNNVPDIDGYEMKKYSRKITLGDFSASEYAFSTKRQFINQHNDWTNDLKITRLEFLTYFGNFNKNRYSWSGMCVPKYKVWNNNGQIMTVVDNNICIFYSFRKDKRNMELPEFLKVSNLLLIAIWKSEKMTNCINNKFNKKGFFVCKKTNGRYTHLCFGKPFDFEYFITSIKSRKVIFDSGMHEGNNRNYSLFRSSCLFDDLITEVY